MKIKTNNRKGFEEIHDGDCLDLLYPNSTTRRGRVSHGISQTIQTGGELYCMTRSVIRRLTPKENFRLQGFSRFKEVDGKLIFDDSNFAKMSEVLSDTKLYECAGNSITVDCLMAIFKELL